MESLIGLHKRLLKNLEVYFRRGLNIEWDDRLIGITGARGVGKTTEVLARIKFDLPKNITPLYVSLDDFYFSNTTLVEFADQWVKTGGTHLFLDEIHKYPNWSQELKNIYDRYPELKIVFTGSSVLHIQKGNADLSRRAVVYTIEGLSFREFLNIELGLNLPAFSLEEILTRHEQITQGLLEEITPLMHFQDYLSYGYYPFFLENKKTYHRKLLSTINLMLEIDLPYLRHVETRYIHKLKKLLYLVAHAVPFQPKITKLAADLEVSRQTVMLYLNYLEESKVLNLLRSLSKSDTSLTKPEKVYLHHPNLMHALSETTVNKGTQRETFFYNQLMATNKVNAAAKGDFLVNGKYTFEVGGKSKGREQLKGLKNGYIAADMIEHGFENKIPLWLFGFLY